MVLSIDGEGYVVESPLSPAATAKLAKMPLWKPAATGTPGVPIAELVNYPKADVTETPLVAPAALERLLSSSTITPIARLTPAPEPKPAADAPKGKRKWP